MPVIKQVVSKLEVTIDAGKIAALIADHINEMHKGTLINLVGPEDVSLKSNNNKLSHAYVKVEI